MAATVRAALACLCDGESDNALAGFVIANISLLPGRDRATALRLLSSNPGFCRQAVNTVCGTVRASAAKGPDVPGTGLCWIYALLAVLGVPDVEIPGILSGVITVSVHHGYYFGSVADRSAYDGAFDGSGQIGGGHLALLVVTLALMLDICDRVLLTVRDEAALRACTEDSVTLNPATLDMLAAVAARIARLVGNRAPRHWVLHLDNSHVGLMHA
jgi:hypothetical protein